MGGLRRARAFDRVVGLCHSVFYTHEFLAETVGVPMDEIAFQTSGFNHQAFVTRFERDGEDLYPELDAAIEADPEGLGRRVRVQLYKELGYFPTESSEHSAEYVSWFMRHDDQIERFRIPVDDYIGRTEEALADYREIVRKLEGGETRRPPSRGASSPPTSSTRSRPARRARSTRT